MPYTQTSMCPKEAETLDLSSLLPELKRLVDLSATHRRESREFENVDAIMKICSKAIFIMYQYAISSAKDFNPDTANTVTRFYNETVKYIMEGTPRSFDLMSWSSILEDISRDWSMVESRGGNIGATAIKQPTYKRPTPTTTRLKEKVVDDKVLSYAHHDIITTWIQRPNGVDDMLVSLYQLINARFY